MSAALKLGNSTSVVVHFGEAMPKGVNGDRCVLVSDQHETLTVMDFLVSSGIHHAVNKNHINFDQELKVAEHMVASPDDFFKDPATIIIGGGLSEGIKGYERVIAQSQEKSRRLSEMKDYLATIPKSKVITDSLTVISDELITNAFYNAPVDGKKQRKFCDIDRNINIGLQEHERPRFIVKHNDSWVMVGVLDPFGSLNPHDLLSHILKGLKNGVNSVMNLESSGGAHIGSLMVLDLSVGLYVAVDQDKRTLVCATLPLGKSHRVIAQHPKSIHVLFREQKNR